MSDLWVCSRWNQEPKDEEKWGVLGDQDLRFYKVRSKFDATYVCYLPKSEYHPCPAPECWETVEVDLGAEPDQHTPTQQDFFHHNGDRAGWVKFIDPGYRVRSLVVERRKAC